MSGKLVIALLVTLASTCSAFVPPTAVCELVKHGSDLCVSAATVDDRSRHPLRDLSALYSSPTVCSPTTNRLLRDHGSS